MANVELRSDPFRSPLKFKSFTSEAKYRVNDTSGSSNSIAGYDLNSSVVKKKSTRADAYMASLKSRRPEWFH